MAGKIVEKDEALLVCSICLDTLKEPVTIPCGHSYCRNCLETCWSQHGAESEPSCPQCRETFTLRPALVKNNILALLVEDLHKKSTPGTEQEEHERRVYSNEELTADDVPCDVCLGQKVKASKSCLQCLASFCPEHLLPHSQAAPLKKHKLVEPLKSLENNSCPEHNEVKKLFCRTDKQCICHICCWDRHKHHQVVYVAVERSIRQEEISPSRQNIRKTINSKKQEVQELQQELLSIHSSADETVKINDRVFQDLANLLEKQRVEFSCRIRAEEKERACSVEVLQKQLLHEITELEKHDEQLDKLSRAEDHNMFLETYLSLPKITKHKELFQEQQRPLGYFQDTVLALENLKDQMENAACNEVENVLVTIQQPDVLLVAPEPETRPEFLKYTRKMTFDPQFANRNVTLSEGNRKVRVSGSWSILSKEQMTQRCYFEVSVYGSIAVSYKETPSSIGSFGNNSSSWALNYHTDPYTYNSSYTYCHNSTKTTVKGSTASTVGVYVDHRAGILAFYRIEKDSMHLIHKVQTTFTKPLYAGVYTSSEASFPQLT